jgi:hypothetical protein
MPKTNPTKPGSRPQKPEAPKPDAPKPGWTPGKKKPVE